MNRAIPEVSEREPLRKGEKTTRKALKLLDFISRQDQAVSTKEIAGWMGVSVPTAYNLLNSLIQEGYVERLPGRSGYRLGPMISRLYQRSLFGGDLVSDVEPVLEELADVTGQRAYLALYKEGKVTMADIKEKRGSPKLPKSEIGLHEAAHALSVGKILMAYAPDEEVKAYAEEHSLEAFTSRTIIDPRRLACCLRETQVRGLATDVEEFAEGFCCMAAPIRNGDSEVKAAIGVSAVSGRFRIEFRDYARAVAEAAVSASAIRGFSD